jgi:hypothetical protein
MPLTYRLGLERLHRLLPTLLIQQFPGKLDVHGAGERPMLLRRARESGRFVSLVRAVEFLFAHAQRVQLLPPPPGASCSKGPPPHRRHLWRERSDCSTTWMRGVGRESS